MNKTIFAVALSGAALVGAAAQAATISFTDSVPLAETDWSETLSVSQFDSNLGTLNSVTVILDGLVTGQTLVENLSGNARDAIVNLTAEITAKNDAVDLEVMVSPVASTTVTLSAYDGTLDFGGTSGTSTGEVTATDTNQQMLTGAAMNDFIGTGLIDIAVDSLGFSFVSGGGNIFSGATSKASAELEVIYDYTVTSNPATVPLPATLPLLAGAFGIAGFAARRRKS